MIMFQLDVAGVAKIAHEANRAYCASLGDYSQVPWDEAPDWQKETVINGVLAVIANPKQTPGLSHDSWLKQKITDGWTHGPEKDPVKKEHPCMVPFGDLPKEQQTKDILFLATVKSACGFSV